VVEIQGNFQEEASDETCGLAGSLNSYAWHLERQKQVGVQELQSVFTREVIWHYAGLY